MIVNYVDVLKFIAHLNEHLNFFILYDVIYKKVYPPGKR